MLDSESQTLKDILIGDNLITEEQMKEVEEEQERNGKSLKEVIIDFGILTEADILEAIGRSLGLEVRSVAVEEDPPREVIKMIDGGTARMLGVVPLSFDGTTLNIITRNPLNYQVVDEVRFIVGKDVNQIVVPEAQVEAAIEKFYPVDVTATMHDMLAELNLDAEIKDDENPEQSADQLEAQANEAPIIKFVDAIMYQAIKDKASDIHFEPFEKEFKIRCRIDGALYEMAPPPKNLALPVISRVKIMSGLNISERRRPQDGRIQLKIGGKPIDLRVSTLPTQYGESVVLRVLDRSVVNLDLDALGIRPENLAKIRDIIQMPNGIFIVTGPTGSGKTTTLYSALKEINKTEDKILTAEDPVEYDLEGIIQLPINEGIGMTFGRALRAFLRQDPDIVMVGEMRDQETAEIAIRAAITGHMVLSTLHTNDAASTITRLVDMGVAPYMVATSLIGIVAQRLCKVVCNECKTPRMSTPEENELLGITESATIYDACGCPKCNNTGYTGRTAIHEILLCTHEMASLIAADGKVDAISSLAKEQGCKLLRDNVAELVLEGRTTLDELVKLTFAV